MDIIKYKEYEGTAELDMERGVCRGKILFIDDLVTYESDSPKGLQKAFEEAVDDYLETCKLLGREAKKPLRGQFNVRVAPELHKSAALRSFKDNVSLNEVVVRALVQYLSPQAVSHTHNHNWNITVSPEDAQVSTIPTSASQSVAWKKSSHAH
jgi:predicted HicB family RNase H-like nuclease